MKIKCTKKDLDALAHKQFISFPGENWFFLNMLFLCDRQITILKFFKY